MKVVFSSRFLRELDNLHDRRGSDFDLDALNSAVEFMEASLPLPAMFRDHALTGVLTGYREFHMGDDDLVVYRQLPDKIIFIRAVRTPSYSRDANALGRGDTTLEH
jgi:addiction module RelE/StbE family toxin